MLLHPNVISEIGEYHVFDGMILYITNEWDNNVSVCGNSLRKIHVSANHRSASPSD